MTFTSVVGKDLMAVDNDSLDQLDSKSIISTYKKERAHWEEEVENIAHLVDEIVMDADLPQTPTKQERRLKQSNGKGMANTTHKSPARNRLIQRQAVDAQNHGGQGNGQGRARHRV